jgi:hypothetical protein
VSAASILFDRSHPKKNKEFYFFDRASTKRNRVFTELLAENLFFLKNPVSDRLIIKLYGTSLAAINRKF